MPHKTLLHTLPLLHLNRFNELLAQPKSFKIHLKNNVNQTNNALSHTASRSYRNASSLCERRRCLHSSSVILASHIGESDLGAFDI